MLQLKDQMPEIETIVVIRVLKNNYTNFVENRIHISSDIQNILQKTGSYKMLVRGTINWKVTHFSFHCIAIRLITIINYIYPIYILFIYYAEYVVL